MNTTYDDPMFIVTYDTAGNYLSGITCNTGGDDNNFINVDNKGNFYISGDYLPDSMIIGTDTLLSLYGPENLLIAKYKYNMAGCTCHSATAASFTETGIPTVSFTYTGSIIYDSLRWFFGDGTTSTIANPVHTYTASGSYNACVDVYSNCPSSDGAFTQYCHTITIADSLTGINNINSRDDGITVYPNPATNELFISATQKINSIAISNRLGQTVLQNQYNSETINVGIANLPPGIYFIKINGYEVRKFIKE
jgi:PKD repeat protein